MAFSKHALQIALASMMIFQFACKEKGDAGNQNNLDDKNNTQVLSEFTAQNNKLTPSKLAEQYASKGKINDAIQVLSEELKTSPENQTILYQLGNLLLEKGDTTKAIKLIQQSIDLGNSDVNAITRLSYMLADNNDANCLVYAKMLIKENNAANSNHLGYFLSGIYYANIGKRKEAISSFDKSIIENFRFIDAYIEKAILLYEGKEFKKSINLLQKSIEIDKFQADIYYWIGRNHEKLNDIDESIYSYEQTLELAPDFANAKFRLDSLNKIKNK